MRIVLSQHAADYIRREASYLRAHSRAAAENFLARVKSVRQDLAAFEQAGEATPIPGLRRIIRHGYRFDYRQKANAIEIVAVSSSVNTPLTGLEDDPDFDFEA